MPANLNALIRYKTINSCFFGGTRKWSIAELIEKCSDALAEYRGRYEQVSERTIRDDIRVMRSDILGYNAPIIQKNGLYFYEDQAYSIMSVTFTDTSLIKKIIRLLDEIKHEVNHPELEIILKRLNALMTGMPESPVKSERKHVRKEKTRSLDIEDKLPEAPSRSYVNDEMISYSKLRYEILSWEDVYRSCNIFPDRVIPHS